MDSREKFEKTKLPPKDAFYSKLNMRSICDQEYEQAQQVWNTTGKKTTGCYHNTYLKTDVLLFADLFETFQNMCLKYYNLSPVHFYASPSLAR